jgi:predicted phosphodiesterase
MVGIISDIHGNHVALSAVFEEFERMGISEVVCLGDVAGYYCQINECCDLLRSRNVFTIMGNHDWYLVSGTGCPRSDSANRCLEHQRRIISRENLDWLGALPKAANRHGIDMVHGGWKEGMDEYLVPSDMYFSNIHGSVFASGHTHVPVVWKGTGKTYCNPGSVGQPRDGNPDTAFATWNGSSFSLHRTSYDVGRVQYAMASAGFPAYFSINLANGTKIGANIARLD